MQIHQNQAWPERGPVMELIFKSAFAQRKIVGIEIGVWYGKGSTQIWLSALGPGSKFFLVDSWRPFAQAQSESNDPNFYHYAGMDRLCTDAFLSTFLEVKRIEMQRHEDDLKIHLLRGDSISFLKSLHSDSIDFIYIDGNHLYESVKEEIVEAKRLVNKSFGLICGDDLERYPSQALYELAIKHPDRDFLHAPHSFHPGVLRAVAEEFQSINMLNGFWWIAIANNEYRPDILRPNNR